MADHVEPDQPNADQPNPDQPVPGRRRRRTVIIGAGLVVIAALAVMLTGGLPIAEMSDGGSKDPVPPAADSGAYAPASPSAADTALAERQDGGVPVRALTVHQSESYDVQQFHAGRLMARRQSALAFDRSGRLVEVAVDVGDRVTRGTVLARLDTRAIEAQRADLVAARDSATASVAELRARLELARLTEQRQARLVGNRNVSQQAYDEARLNVTALEAQEAAAEAEVKRLDAQVDGQDVALDLSLLVAPYDGQIIARTLDEGAAVQPGQELFDLRETGTLEARIGVASSDLPALAEGQRVELTVEGVAVPATVRRIVDSLDLATRTATVVMDVDPADAGAGGGVVLSGQIIHMSLPRTIAEPGLWVPLEALTEGRRGLWAAFAIVADDRPGKEGTLTAQRREVDVLYVDGERVYVRGSLSEGDRIVAGGLHRLAPGMTVRVIDAGGAPADEAVKNETAAAQGDAR